MGYSLKLYAGPVAFKDASDTHTLVGVVSFGPWSCYDDYLPSVFARVTEVMDWIRAYVKDTDEECPPKIS